MEKNSNVLVVGGGIAGIQAALDLSERGIKVHLVEKTPSIGGRMAQLDKTFPTMDCSICILAPKMIECDRHPNITLLTCSELTEVTGEPGNFSAKILKKPRFVDDEKCTGCNDCTKVCPVTVPSEFDMNLGPRKAIYRPFPQAVPKTFAIDKTGTPRCVAACPAGVNVQGYIALIRQKKYKEALELIRKDNPLPIVCGRVCFHPCEDNCERGKLDQPVAVNALKRFVTDWELEHGGQEKVLPVPKVHDEKIAILGSGPAGLTAAHELVRRGYPVTLFESMQELGGALRAGIPEYRLPKKLLEVEIKHITDLGVEIRKGTTIGEGLTLDKLRREDYRAILIATGAAKSRRIEIEDEELEGIVQALDFLKKANVGESMKLGDRVAVIGGGNVAVDAARTAIRLGAYDVRILYRRAESQMPAFPAEVEEAKKEGVKFQFLVMPKRILGKNGKVSALECMQTELGEPDESGRQRPVPVKGSEFTISLDTIVLAVGEQPDLSFISLVGKKFECDQSTLQTMLPDVFAAGDFVTGPATVVDAIAAGRKAAESIDRYLRGVDLVEGRERKLKKVEEVPKENIERKTRFSMPRLPVEKRAGSFHEVELGFSEEMALQEAGRCLNCGVCSECLECEKVCEPKAIVHGQKEEYLEINVQAIVLATGFDSYIPIEVREYGYGRYKNVVTSMELERLLSASGPTGGRLTRLSDNKTPRKIAFIQCVGSRSLKSCFSYCSAVCCMYAAKEATLIKEHAPETEVYVLYTDIRAFGKGFQQFVNRGKEEWGIEYFRAKPGEIREDSETRDLQIKFEDTLTGEIKKLQVNFAVLCTALAPSSSNKELAKILDIDVDEYGYFRVQHRLHSPLDATRAGVFISGCCQSPKDIPDSVAQAKGAAARVAEFISQLHS